MQLTTAMILAAGRGERMRPLTDHLPKPLLTVQGKPLIVYHLEALKKAGFERVVINHAWQGEKLEQCLGSGQQFGLDIVYSAETTALETAGGIIKALPLLSTDNPTGQFAVVNGDVYSDFDFATLTPLSPSLLAHLVLVDNPLHNPAGDFALHHNLVQQQGDDKLTFAGIAVYRTVAFNGMATEKRPLAPLLKAMMTQHQVSGQHFQGQWSDVGTPQRLEQLNQQEHGQ